MALNRPELPALEEAAPGRWARGGISDGL